MGLPNSYILPALAFGVSWLSSVTLVAVGAATIMGTAFVVAGVGWGTTPYDANKRKKNVPSIESVSNSEGLFNSKGPSNLSQGSQDTPPPTKRTVLYPISPGEERTSAESRGGSDKAIGYAELYSNHSMSSKGPHYFNHRSGTKLPGEEKVNDPEVDKEEDSSNTLKK